MNKDSKQERFKNHLRKIASGENTSRAMTREESAEALELILHGVATPAQIGAFMIAHRIRRPEPQELAGMVDTYLKLGPKLKPSKNFRPPICFGMPLDGRNKTAPIYPLTTLILIDLGQPVVLHGAGRIPIKYGVSGTELFEALGLSLSGLSMDDIQDCFSNYGFAYINQADHFPLAQNLVSYRDEIGKRPPLASMELLWTAHSGEHLLITSFVHPPTEPRHLKAAEILGESNVVTVKGLEGSTDISISRSLKLSQLKNTKIKTFSICPIEYKCNGKDLAWNNIHSWQDECMDALNGKGAFQKSVIWNAGIYLWLAELVNSISEGMKKAETSLKSGSAQSTLKELIKWRKTIN